MAKEKRVEITAAKEEKGQGCLWLLQDLGLFEQLSGASLAPLIVFEALGCTWRGVKSVIQKLFLLSK